MAVICIDIMLTFLALICGTSTGHMSIFDRPVWAKGAWGPFKGAIFPDLFVHMAGQSISGILLDHVIKNHPAYPKMLAAADSQHPQQYLNGLLPKIAQSKGIGNLQELTSGLHVWPDFHGNRSPLDDPSMRGMVSDWRLLKYSREKSPYLFNVVADLWPKHVQRRRESGDHISCLHAGACGKSKD